MRVLPVQPFRQRRARCGPAALKMVVDYYGVRKSERELARLAGATPAGTSAQGILRAARRAGLRGFVKDRGSFADLRKYVLRQRTPVIVDWFAGDDGHYSPVVGIDRKRITLQDPALGRRQTLSLSTFRRLWFDFPGSFFRSPRDLILRRMIVLRR